ncbi:cbb3-type cytochrome oxidase maturation protein [Neisseria perflava]|uniref:cbb3-type cytochrome oxidase assembly protein CcoS n=1 Tax=Neisseria perflava TaxID=33053 RepID=UPI00209EA043|nr:cbb3-type cytochrome oxidase assembly protein CcoS [Neisseria perflava]MCP1773359.1 cbb3-type cytochrome oxidase maturation protein [Neisseria perflava]
MESLFILIPLSILLACLIGYFFWWSGKNGQFDDLEGPAYRILMDDDSTDGLLREQEADKAKTEEKRK